MFRIEFQNPRRNFVQLTMLFQNSLQIHIEIVVIGDKANRTVGQSGGGPYVLNRIAQLKLNSRDERIYALDCLLGFCIVVRLVLARIDLLEIGTASGHRLEWSCLVHANRGQPEFVDRIRHQKDFDAFRTESFQLRTALNRFQFVAGYVVNRFLALFHPRCVFREADQLIASRRPKSNKIKQLLAMLEIFVETFLQRRTKRLPETSISFAFLFRLLSQRIQNTAGDAGLNPGEYRVVLQQFAADIQGQIFGIDHPAQKAQPRREKMLAVIGDEDTLYIQLHATFALRMKQIERPRRWHIK